MGSGPARRGDDPDSAEDEARLAQYAAELADGVESALVGWVPRVVALRFGAPLPVDVARRAAEAGRQASIEVGGQVRRLLALDIDQQWTNPLALLRTAVRYPAAVLADAGVTPPARDREAERLHPDDVYDLTPANFGDLDPALQEPGIVWGAAKAHVHLRRRRAEGRR